MVMRNCKIQVLTFELVQMIARLNLNSLHGRRLLKPALTALNINRQ